MKGLGWVGTIVGMYLACWVFHGPGRVIERTVAIGVRRTLTDELYARLSAAPLGWHETRHSAELAHRVSQASHALANFTQNQFIYLQNTVNLIGPMVALLLVSWTIGALSASGLLAIGMTIVAFDRVLTRLAVRENEGERRYAALLHDCLSNVSSVLSLRLQRSTRRLLSVRLNGVFEPLRRNISLTEWKWCAVDLLTVMLTWSLVLAYAWEASSRGALMLGGVFMVYQYAQQAGSVIGSLAANLQRLRPHPDRLCQRRADLACSGPRQCYRSRALHPGHGAVPLASFRVRHTGPGLARLASHRFVWPELPPSRWR